MPAGSVPGFAGPGSLCNVRARLGDRHGGGSRGNNLRSVRGRTIYRGFDAALFGVQHGTLYRKFSKRPRWDRRVNGSVTLRAVPCRKV